MASQPAKKRVFSGVQPTGKLTLGNYIGALDQWVKHQGEDNTIFCVVDLHTLTLPEEMSPKERFQKTYETLALYLACGIDPKQSALFIQSHIREHTELTWVLNCTTPLGWLERMTQFKTKSQGRESIGTGLLDYPVLMASDILLYQTDLVPVGEDQKQHVELTCEIARRFNGLFGEAFQIPKVVIRQSGARIMGLDDPTVKMSKSIAQNKPHHAICLLDDEKTIQKTVMSAVTDSGSEVQLEQASPGIKNLLAIYEALSKEPTSKVESLFQGKGYGTLKKAVLERVLHTLRPIQQRYQELQNEPSYLQEVAKEGTLQVRPLAEQTMEHVRTLVGLSPPHFTIQMS